MSRVVVRLPTKYQFFADQLSKLFTVSQRFIEKYVQSLILVFVRRGR
jgi:hypothetical protein